MIKKIIKDALESFAFYFLVLSCFLFLASKIFSPAANAKTYGDIEVSRIVSVYDGDTIKVDIAGMHPIIGDSISVRVKGVDTPEIRGKCVNEKGLAKSAKYFVKNKLKSASSVTLKDVERGKYFRLAAYVYVDDVPLDKMLINAGLGVEYNGGKRVNVWCDK